MADAKEAVKDPRVRDAIKKMKRDAEETGTSVSISSGDGTRTVTLGEDTDEEAVAEIMAPVTEQAVAPFKAQATGQVNLEGRKTEWPIKQTSKLVRHYYYESILARLSFTENAIKSKCIEPPEDKDPISIRVFVQQRLKYKSNTSLTGDEMGDLVKQFTEAVREDWA